MADIEVRLVSASEYDAAGELSEAAYRHDYTISDVYRADIRDVAARAVEHQVWVAVDVGSGELLGTVATPRPGARLSELARPGELDFRLLAVSPAARRRGVGRLLVEHVIDLARARYAVAVVMNSGPQMLGAHRLYEQLGFSRLPERETRVVDGGTRLLAFGLDLTTAADGTPTRALDNPALASLNSHHTHFAERRGEVARYRTDVSPWTGIPDQPTEQDWADLAGLLGPGGTVGLPPTVSAPAGWQAVGGGEGVQLIDESVQPRPDPEAVLLTADDVPEILELIERTKPGPYLPRTIEMGAYLGIRRHGRLIAMAGERLHPPGFTEISAVCTDAEFRGQGLGTRLVLAVAAGIRERGETPFMHAVATNVNAIRLYEQLGFRLRRRAAMHAVQIPQ
ncbi:GNAT family N-acetyltransferase [Dactylosporangium sp. NPDC051485]|uniref:GNAT family N-acetyltransferase n=1 Tax=Dactylosporangium sp. NPDC051485 TaxID=3154846 RepID=UPI0034213825